MQWTTLEIYNSPSPSVSRRRYLFGVFAEEPLSLNILFLSFLLYDSILFIVVGWEKPESKSERSRVQMRARMLWGRGPGGGIWPACGYSLRVRIARASLAWQLRFC